MSYYKECNQLIADNKLNDCVEFLGHVDIKKGLAQHNVGYVLSMSEKDLGLPGFESFHLAIADGFCAEAVSVIKKWPGAETVWPKECIETTIRDVVIRIEKLSKDTDAYMKLSDLGKQFVCQRYDILNFSDSVKDLFLELS